MAAGIRRFAIVKNLDVDEVVGDELDILITFFRVFCVFSALSDLKNF